MPKQFACALFGHVRFVSHIPICSRHCCVAAPFFRQSARHAQNSNIIVSAIKHLGAYDSPSTILNITVHVLIISHHAMDWWSINMFISNIDRSQRLPRRYRRRSSHMVNEFKRLIYQIARIAVACPMLNFNCRNRRAHKRILMQRSITIVMSQATCMPTSYVHGSHMF